MQLTSTFIFLNFSKDHNKLSDHVGKVEEETKENSREIQNLNSELKKVNVNIETLFRLSNEFRAEMDELSAKVADLYLMKKALSVSAFYFPTLVVSSLPC